MLTPKAISNRIKSAGLQKLRWYCQMCEKQCRDENGFKCHAQSEGHLRNMQIYAQNPAKFREKFSGQFRSHFVKELGRRHHTNQVKATSFYADYIKDKDHLHMNSTKWRSLTEFILDLSRDGLIRAEETEKGWFITWIDRSAVSDAEKKAEKEKMELDDAERDRQRTNAQLKAAREQGKMTDHVAATMLEKDKEVEFKLLDGDGLQSADKKRRLGNAFEDEEEEEDDNDGKPQKSAQGSNSHSNYDYKKPMSNLEEIALREMERRKKRSRDEKSSHMPPPKEPARKFQRNEWLTEGIIVKVMSKKLSGGEYYKKKGMVFEVHDHGAVGDVEMLDSQDAIRLPSEQLETVIPSVGGRVIIVDGAHRGEEAVLEKLNVEKYSANVKVKRTRNVLELPYESICKLK